MASISAVLARAVRDHMSAPPPLVPGNEGCGQVVALMTEAAASSAVVVDGDGRPAGIVTESDIVRRAAFRGDPDAPASGIMTSPVRTVGADDLLYQAVGAMRRFGLRHMPVVDAAGAVCGMLDLRDALSDSAAETVALIDRLTHDATAEGLAAVKAAEVEAAGSLLADDQPAADIQRLLSHVNRDIYRRVTGRAIAAMDAAGLGPPPVAFCVIVMGSGGRNENYLYPDQDNGFVLADYPDDAHGDIDPWFVELAVRMTAELDAIGFPFCKGGVMATNPVWRKTLGQWRVQTALWARKRSPTAVRLMDIFFDFQPVAGEAEFATELRRYVTGLMRGNIAFLREIHHDQASFGTALGFLGRLRTISDKGPFKGQIDLKRGVLLPLVNAVRILALRDGVAATPTLARIAALREIGTLDDDEADEISAVFRLVSGLALSRQIACYTSGQPVGYALPPAALTRRARRELKDGLRAVGRLRDRIGGELTGDVLGGGRG